MDWTWLQFRPELAHTLTLTFFCMLWLGSRELWQRAGSKSFNAHHSGKYWKPAPITTGNKNQCFWCTSEKGRLRFVSFLKSAEATRSSSDSSSASTIFDVLIPSLQSVEHRQPSNIASRCHGGLGSLQTCQNMKREVNVLSRRSHVYDVVGVFGSFFCLVMNEIEKQEIISPLLEHGWETTARTSLKLETFLFFTSSLQ